MTGQENKTDSNKTDNDQSTSGAVYVHGSSNLRSGPGLSYGTVSSVADGKTLVWLGEVSVDDRGVMWYKVLRNNGEAAWISSRYSELKTSDGSEPEIPFGKLMKGNKGERVLELQTMLKELGYHTGSCDGDYGSGTEKSVKAFQEAFKEKAGLIVTGEVDEATWNAIKEALEPEKVEEEIGDISFEEILEEITEGEEYPNTAYISQINRTALDRWLNNKDENYSHNSGYMLLEQTLDANSNGVWTAVADNMFSYAFDFLHLLLDSYSGNAAGGVSGALDLSVSFGLEFYDAEAIERMLIETYAEYMADMQQEAQAAQDQYNANLNLYRAYMKVKELYEAGDFVLKTAEPGDTAVRTVKFMIQEDLSLRDMAYLSLDRSEAMSRAISACLTEGNVQAGEIEALNEMINKYNKYHESAVQLRESGIGDKLSQWGYALDALSLVNSSLALCEKYGYEAERYAGMIGFMAYSSAEYLAMLDEWAQAAEEMGAGKYADAIEQFRKDFEIITRQQVEKLIMNNAGQESMDEVVDVLNATAAVVGDTVEVYRKSKGIATTQTFSWSLVSRTAETMIRDAMEWDEKAELMEKMVYCRNLKETLASSLQKQLSEFDAMADGEAKEEKAAVIIAGLKYMKSLKYHGECLALNLCELLTEAGNYMQSDYQLVAKINGTWAVIGGVVQPADGGYYTDTPLDLVQMEGLEYGYIKNGNITMMNAGDNGVFWRLAHRQVWIEWVPTMTDALMDEMIMTTEEMLEDQEMKARINERKRQENAQMPEHIEYWEKYVEDFSIPAIEWIE